nr:reverse transcriptase domain-containing protein [Tanacetum cinerariifolium]
MSNRSSARNLFPPLDNPELTIRRRSHADPTLLNDFEMAAEGNGDPPVPDLRTMKELCQPFLNGRGGPIASIAIQATNFRLNNDMIQQVQNSCQFHGLPGDDANEHLDKFLHLRNEITNFCQRLDESLFEASERYKLSIDRCPNHNMLPVTQIDTFYNGLTLRHRDTINAAAKRNLYEKASRRISITSSFDLEIVALKAEMAEINKNLVRVLKPPLAKPRTYMLREPIKVVIPTNFKRNKFFQGASHGQNPPPAYQAPGYQAPVHQPSIPQSKVMTTNEFTNFMKANDAILKNMQTNMTSLTNSNLELKTMFGQFMKMNTTSSLVLETLPGNTVTNPKKDLKGITTRSGTAYQGPTIPTTSSSLPKVVERETEVTEDTVPPTNNESTKDVQPLVVQTETPILNSKPVVAPIIEPVVALRSFLKTRRAFIDVFEGELTLRVGKEAITFNLDQTSRYSANYNDMKTNRIDVINMACEEYSQEVLGFSNVIASGNPTPYYDPIVSTSSPTLTPFGDSDFLLEEVDAFLALEDDPTSPEVDQSYFNLEGDILFLEAFLNDDPSLPPPNQGNYLP